MQPFWYRTHLCNMSCLQNQERSCPFLKRTSPFARKENCPAETVNVSRKTCSVTESRTARMNQTKTHAVSCMYFSISLWRNGAQLTWVYWRKLLTPMLLTGFEYVLIKYDILWYKYALNLNPSSYFWNVSPN